MLGELSVANAELCVHTYSRFRVFSPILILYAAITKVTAVPLAEFHHRHTLLEFTRDSSVPIL